MELREPVSAKHSVAGAVEMLALPATQRSTRFGALNDQVRSAGQFLNAIIEGLTVIKAKQDPFNSISQVVK